MKLNNRINIFLLASIILLFSILIFNQINSTDKLYNYDSWHHLYFTEHGESEQFFSDSIETYDGELTSPYKSFLRSEIYLFHIVTGISLFEIFQFASIFLRILFVLMVYITALTFTKNKIVSLLTTILIFTSYYFVWRSYLTFPENLAIIFFLFSIWALENYKLKDKKIYLVFLIFVIISIAYVHPISLIFLCLILASYLLFFLINKNYRQIKVILWFILASLIFIAPIVNYLFALLKDRIFGNIGSESAYGSIAETMVQYTPPAPSTYIYYSGLIMILLSILGVIYLFKKDIKNNLPVIFILTFSFILSLGSWLHIYVPTDRMQAYLFIPLVIVSSIYLKNLLLKKPKYVTCIIIFLIIIFSVFNVISIPPWFALWHGESEMGNYLNQNYNLSKLYSFDGLEVPLLRFEHPESITENKSISDYIITKNPNIFGGYKQIKQFKEYCLLEKNEI